MTNNEPCYQKIAGLLFYHSFIILFFNLCLINFSFEKTLQR